MDNRVALSLSYTHCTVAVRAARHPALMALVPMLMALTLLAWRQTVPGCLRVCVDIGCLWWLAAAVAVMYAHVHAGGCDSC